MHLPSRRTPLPSKKGAVLLSASSEFGDGGSAQWIAMGLIDGTAEIGWSSAKNATFPHRFVFELSTDFSVSSIALDSRQVEETNNPGISPRKVLVEVSTESRNGPFNAIASAELERQTETTVAVPDGTRARWVRLSILSNWGDPSYTGLMELKVVGRRITDRPTLSDLKGTYKTNWNNFFIRSRDGQLLGCYNHDNGTFAGAPDGWFLNIEWREDGPQIGKAVMAITEDGSHFSGFWYENSVLGGTWIGSRIDTDPPGCAAALLEDDRSRVARALDTDGRVALYGIYFDTDSDVLKPESDAVLHQLLAWMAQNPDTHLSIEGHTDADGT